MDERIEDLLALYALGGLTPDEQREIDAHLARHPEMEDVLREMMETTTALARSSPALPPSQAMEDALMARVAADAAARFAPRPKEVVRNARPSLLQALRSIMSSPFVSTVGFAVAALLLVWVLQLNGRLATSNEHLDSRNAEVASLQAEVDAKSADNQTLASDVNSLTSENQELRTQLTALMEERDAAEDMLALLLEEKEGMAGELAALLAANETLASDFSSLEANYDSLFVDYTSASEIVTLFTSAQAQQVVLPGTEAEPAAEGQLLYDPASQVAVLFVDDMPQLDTGEVYQVLLIRDDGHDTAETFAVNVQGQHALIVHAEAPLNTFTAVGVSVEPDGGSVQRTGDVVLLGELARS